MSRGEALNDQDRLPWLCRLREVGIRTLEGEVSQRSERGRNGIMGEDVGVVLACSSLKGCYRQILRGKLEVEQAPGARPGETRYETREVEHQASPSFLLPTYFVWIKGDKKTLGGRMLKRKGHFFKTSMLDGQLRALEPPEGEPGVVVVPLEPPTEEQVEMALQGLREVTGGEFA